MSQTIKLKRNKTNSATTPSTLSEGELAVNILDKSLFVGDGDNVVRLYIGSDKYFNSDGYANNAVLFGGNEVSHFGTAAQITALNKSISSINANFDNYLSKISGGEVEGDVLIKAVLKMNTLYLPNSNNTPSDYQMSVGVLGSGADTPSGGSGADVSSIVVYDANGVRLGNGNSEGNIVIAAYPTSLPASDVYAWAKKSSLAASDVPNLDWSKITSGKPTTLAGYGITDKVAYRETLNNFMHSTNEFTFAAPAYSSYIWMNYRTASGSLDGAITEYRFAKGAGATYADIRAAKYIVNTGTSSQFLKADGSLDGTSYLPLSGGTVTGLVTFATNEISLDGMYLAYSSGALRVRTQSGDSWFGMMNDTACHIYTDASLFYMNKPLKVDNGYDVIHSGNYSNYALPINLNIPFESTVNAYGYGYTSGGWATSGSALIVGANSLYRMAIQGESNNTLLYRYCYNGTWGKERYFAFTDSNVASATKLQTARTIWGQSFDGTGNIDGAFKYGLINLEANNEINSKSTDGTGQSLCLNFQGDGDVIVCYGGGNVLIGTAADAGYKFAVNGSALANTVRTQELRLGATAPSSDITKKNWYYASITYEYTDVSPSTLKPDIVFKTMYDTYAENSGVERMRIKSNGNVGVNTDAPASTLHVNGSFRAGSSMLDSLTVYGSASLAAENKHYTRLGNTSYNSGWYHGTAGNEAMAFINNAAVSSFMFVQGKTAIENWDTGTWQSVTPALQIKQNCVAINYLWGQNVTPDYTLRVAGTAYFSGNISASGYQLPTTAPSNPVSGGYYLYVGTLGTGATIS